MWAARASLDLPTYQDRIERQDTVVAPAAQDPTDKTNDSVDRAASGKGLFVELMSPQGNNKKRSSSSSIDRNIRSSDKKSKKTNSNSVSSSSTSIAIQLQSTDVLREKLQQLEQEEEHHQQVMKNILVLQAKRANRVDAKENLSETLMNKMSTKQLEALEEEMMAEEDERKRLLQRIAELQERKKQRCE